MLNDPVATQYTHTLTVTAAGLYTCTVANNKPSNDSATYVLAGEDFRLYIIYQTLDC